MAAKSRISRLLQRCAPRSILERSGLPLMSRIIRPVSLARSPAPIETMTYPGAYHAWTVPGLTTLRFYPEYPSTKQCPLILLGARRPALLIDGGLTPFD